MKYASIASYYVFPARPGEHNIKETFITVWSSLQLLIYQHQVNMHKHTNTNNQYSKYTIPSLDNKVGI